MTATKNQAEKKNGKYGHSYLFRAEVDKNSAVVRGTMDWVPNRVFLSVDTRIEDEDLRKKAPLVPWCTNENGMIHTITTQLTDGNLLVRGDCPPEMPFIFPPTDLALYTYAAQGKEWKNGLTEAVKRAGDKLKPLMLRRTRVTGKQMSFCLRQPEKAAGDVKDQEYLYRLWYENMIADPQKVFTGYVIPNVRAIFFVFTSDLFRNASVTFWTNGMQRGRDAGIEAEALVIGDNEGTSGKGEPSRFWLTTYRASPKILKPGIYTVEVTLDPVRTIEESKANKKFANSKILVFKTHVKFDTTNVAGSFAVVACDPVSVEEAMMVQFPKQFANMLAMAQQTDEDRQKVAGKTGESFDETIPLGLKPWSERLALSKAILGQAGGILGADSRMALFKAVGERLWRVLEEHGNETLRSAVSMIFGVADAVDAWKGIEDTVRSSLVKALATEKTAARMGRTPLMGLFKAFNEKDFRGIVPARLSDDLAASHAKWQVRYLKAEANQVLQKSALRRWGACAKNLAGLAEYPLTAYALFDGWSAYLESKGKTDRAEAKYDELCKTFAEKICPPEKGAGKEAQRYFSCREAAAHLEKMRAVLMALEMTEDQDLRQALVALHDAVLVGLTLLPATAPVAGLVAVAEGAASLTWTFGRTVTACADRLLFDNALARFMSERETFIELEAHYSGNTRRLTKKGLDLTQADRPEGHVAIQHRLRAEVLYGLFWLITWCAVQVDDKTSLEDNLKTYRVHAYIRNYVLNDGWAFSLFSLYPAAVPQDLDGDDPKRRRHAAGGAGAHGAGRRIPSG